MGFHSVSGVNKVSRVYLAVYAFFCCSLTFDLSLSLGAEQCLGFSLAVVADPFLRDFHWDGVLCEKYGRGQCTPCTEYSYPRCETRLICGFDLFDPLTRVL